MCPQLGSPPLYVYRKTRTWFNNIKIYYHYLEIQVHSNIHDTNVYMCYYI